MGVPAFFRWLSRKYPSIVVHCKEEKVYLASYLGPNLLIVSFSSAKVTKHNEGGRVLPLLHYIEMLHFRHFFLVYTHPTRLTCTLNNHYDIFSMLNTCNDRKGVIFPCGIKKWRSYSYILCGCTVISFLFYCLIPQTHPLDVT